MPLSIHVLIPAWNEADKLGETIESLLAQNRPADRIVVIPNGCTDETPDIAWSYALRYDNVTVLELPKLAHRKSEALNRAWSQYSQEADVVITVDADTTFPPDALELWEREFQARSRDKKGRPLGGSVAKAVVLGEGFWKRMQKLEYSRVVDSALIRGTTTVLAGAGTAFSGKALVEVANLDDGREGPWSYDSMTEDYEITLQMRKLGWLCITSPTVRMYTDGMKDLPSLWSQRMKWATGQSHELLRHGITRYTLRDWGGHFMMTIMIAIQFLWIWVIGKGIASGALEIHWFWWGVYPAIFLLFELYMCSRTAHVDRNDYLWSLAVFPAFAFRAIGMAWLIWSTVVVIREKLTGQFADRWEHQKRAERETVA